MSLVHEKPLPVPLASSGEIIEMDGREENEI